MVGRVRHQRSSLGNARRQWFAMLAAILVTVGVTATSSLAVARGGLPPPCSQSHCYSSLHARGSLSGAEVQFTNQALVMPSEELQVGGHITNEIWLVTQLSTSVEAWVETGLADQCNKLASANQTCATLGGVAEYQLFWADNYGPPGCIAGCFYFHSKGSQAANGTNHVYEIWDPSNGANNNYNVYYDYNLIGTSTIQRVPSGVKVRSGMELYAPNGIGPSQYTGNFNNYTEGYQNGVGWIYFNSSDSYGSVSVGCSNHPQGYCLNGIGYQPSEWSDSKPG